MRKLLSSIGVFMLLIVLVACGKTYKVTFKYNNGENDKVVEVKNNELVSKPTDPIKEGYNFKYWFITEGSEFNFQTHKVNDNIILNALWELKEVEPEEPEEPEKVLTTEDLINEDISLVGDNLVNGPLLNLPLRGSNGSMISWKSSSEYVSIANKLLIPSVDGSVTKAVIRGTFKLKGETIEHEYEVDLPTYGNVSLTKSKNVQFTNLTTEYNVENKQVILYYEEEGNVPYIKVEQFFNLLRGFIDPDLEITFNKNEAGKLTISYDYYSKLEDHTYHLVAIIDSLTNTITTEDPGFYSAYVLSTETNYGRHIEYDLDNENSSYKEGNGLVLNLGNYHLNVELVDGEIALPYALVNQLFAGSSYYNVYFNGDNLFGVYSLPDSTSEEYITMKSSSKNGNNIEYDMMLHTFNMLAFNLDNFYGLKNITGDIDSYYSLLYKNKDSLFTLDPSKFEDGLFNFINKNLDELHTSYDSPSHYNTKGFKGPKLTSLDQLGRRVRNWYEKDLFTVQDLIDLYFDGEQPNYWFLDDESVVVTLDGFRTLDIVEDSLYNAEVVNNILKNENIIPSILNGDKYFYVNSSTQDNRVLNVLVKNTNVNYIEDYMQSLVNNGFVRMLSTDNYFEKIVGNKVYTLYVSYSDETKVFTVSVVDQSFDNETNESKSLIKTGEYDYINGDSALYLEIILEQVMRENANVKNLVLDVTYNTGGNVGALYRVVGFVTNEPFRTTNISPDTNSASTSHVIVNGVPDYSHLNWGVLASGVSFSAANSLVTIFKENNLGPVIGMISGGGASSITPILLPNGTSFIMSSTNVGGYRTGDGTLEDPYVYHDNEYGITPDYMLTYNKLYDDDTILNAMNDYFSALVTNANLELNGLIAN